MQIPRTRPAALLAAAALASVVAAVALWRAPGAAPDAGYTTEPVERGAIATLVTATGIVNPVTTVQVGTYVSGPILEIGVDFNSPVRKGQRVAKIDPAPFQMRVDQAAASLATARARVAKAGSDLALKKLNRDRMRQLVGRKLVAQNDYDTASSDHDQAQAQLALEEAGARQAEAALQEARINLAYTDIVSPVDGVVVSRNVDVGQTVAASFQTPVLFQIAQDLTEMQVNAAVSESDIGGVREGQPATFTVDAYPGRSFGGRVVQVRNAPTTLQNVVTYDVVIGVDNGDLALKPGMTATATITTAQRDDVLRLPVRALRFRPEQAEPAPDGAPAVWVLATGGELRRVEVETGLRNDRWAELLGSALAAGDAVVVAARRAAEPEPPAQSPFVPRRVR